MTVLKRPEGVPDSIWLCFEAAYHLAGYKIPYEFGGGHPGPGYTLGKRTPWKRYDCSGWVSDIIFHGGILGHSHFLDTEELMEWGELGEGKYMTVWVINQPELKHTFIEFNIPGYPEFRWSMAAHTDTIDGWYRGMSTKGYTPRRRKP